MSQSSSSWFSNLSTSIVETTSKLTNVVQKTLQSQSINDEQKYENNNNKLTNIFNDFSSTVLKSAQQLKQVVEDKSLIGNFTKEHDKFLSEKHFQQKREAAAVPPWVGFNQEEEMKKQILALSQDQRHFIRSPPEAANYHFDMQSMYPIALVTLEADENLKQMRFELVPRKVTEEKFWKNYFYRVNLIKQSIHLAASINENNIQLNNNNKTSDEILDILDNSSDINQEFVSEDYDISAINSDDIRRELEELNVIKKISDIDENEWDHNLENVDELEQEINQMLAETKK